MSFPTLPEAEQAERLADLARAALPAWGLAGAKVSLLKYRENAVFRVDAGGDEPRVLRVHRPRYRTDSEIRSEMAWMRAVEGVDIRTPEVLPTRAGEWVITASAAGVPEPRQCDLVGWVEGAPLGTLEQGVDLDGPALRQVYATVGRVAARLHAHGEAWARPADFARPAWDAAALVGDAPTFGAFWDLAELEDSTRSLLLRARDRVRKILECLPPPRALVHGDLIPDNLLVSGADIHVIDFDDCGTSWLGFELATTLFSLRVTSGFDDALAGMLEGYRSVRPFSEEELALLPDFLLARGLSYLGWPVGRAEIASQRAIVPFLTHVLVGMAEERLDAPIP